MFWLLLIVSAIVFGGFSREFSLWEQPPTERLTIGAFQPWYTSSNGPRGWDRSWNLITVSGAAGVLALICLSWLLAILLWEQPRSASDGVRDEIQRAGYWLAAAGIVGVVGSCVLAFIFLAYCFAGLGLAGEQILLYWAVFFVVWGLVAGPLIISGGHAMRRIRSPGLAWIGVVVAMVPVSPGVLLGLPVGMWCLTLLCRREVRNEFQRAAWLAKNSEFQYAVSGDSKS